jgi:hypothetical protein
MNDQPDQPRVSAPGASRLQRGTLSRWRTFLLIAAAASFHCSGAPRHIEKFRDRQAVTPPIRTVALAPASAPVELSSPRDPRPKTVVVVVIDGARWQEIFSGTDRALAKIHALPESSLRDGSQLVPTLHGIIENGGAALGAPDRGAPIAASGPAFVSVPGYIEIFSGRPAVNCLNNRCRWSGQSNLLDQIAENSRGRPGDVAVFASWPGMLRTVSPNSRGVLVSAGRKGRKNFDPLLDDREAAELYARGARSDSYPGQGDYRPDRHTAELALYHLRRNRPRFMLLSLGDADKFGHANMYRRYLEALHESDKVVAQTARVLDELAAQGWPSTLLVTADHGRDRRCREHGRQYPESARTWLIARGAGIVDHGYVSAPRPRRLADIAPTLRKLLDLEADDGASAGTPMVELLSAPVDRRTAALGQ